MVIKKELLDELLASVDNSQDLMGEDGLDPFPKSGEHLLRLGGLHFELHWTDIS